MYQLGKRAHDSARDARAAVAGRLRHLIVRIRMNDDGASIRIE
jgi:hypothetical protein